MLTRHPVFGATLGRHRVRRQCSGAPMGEGCGRPLALSCCEPQWRPFRKGRGQSDPCRAISALRPTSAVAAQSTHRDQQNDDLARLFESAERVAGLAADLPQLNRAISPRTMRSKIAATAARAGPRQIAVTRIPRIAAAAALQPGGRPAANDKPSGAPAARTA